MRRPSLPKLSRRRPLLAVLIAVLMIAGIVLLALVVFGGDDDKDVRQTVERFGQASRDKDYQVLCDELLSTALVQQVRSVGQPCEVALRIALGEVLNPTLEVTSVDINGDEALARVDSKAAGQRPSQDTVRLIRENDGWRIAALANEAPPDPTP